MKLLKRALQVQFEIFDCSSFRKPVLSRRDASSPAAGAGRNDFAAGAPMSTSPLSTMQRPFWILLSAGLGFLTAFAVWTGLVLSFYVSYPVGFFVTAIAFAGYLASEVGKRWRLA